MDIYGNEAYNVRKTLERVADILQELLGVAKKPENKVMTVFKYVGAIVSALGILSIVEIIRQWIYGG